MNCNPTLTADEFRQLHNGLWELDRMVDKLLHGNVYEGQALEKIAKTLRDSLKGAYQQDNSAFETKHDYYTEYQRGHGFKSIWSIFELAPGGFDQVDPYRDSEYVVYSDHWGDHEVVKKIEGPTWGDLYRAADAAIKASGDGHHCFIESFTPIEDKPGHLRLGTGS